MGSYKEKDTSPPLSQDVSEGLLEVLNFISV